MTQKTPKTITNEESAKLLDVLLNSKKFCRYPRNRIRNYTMAVLMLDAGLRVGELVRLQRASLWLNHEPVKGLFIPADITKTHTSRTIPLTERSQKANQEMYGIWWYSIAPAESNFAFYNFDHSKHITVRQVQRIIAWSSRLAFGRAITPHILRHTFATRMMRITSTPVVQELLGHKSLTSTQVYTHPNGDDLQKAIAGLNA